ncbi:MAG: hypothetical protein WA130_01910 [Candidatus Methanoperedens sp.]
MKRMGICSKCGEYRLVQDHHYKGYKSDEVKPYCLSCDWKAHNKARKEGRCKLSGWESNRLSTLSSNRRSHKTFNLSWNMLEEHIQLKERIFVNLNNGNIIFDSCFVGTNHIKLKRIKET